LSYDPALRVVRWAPPIVEAPAPAPQPDLAPPPVGTPYSAHTLHPTLTAAGARLTCPSCHVPLVAASSGSLVVCPNCGRLATTRSRARPGHGEFLDPGARAGPPGRSPFPGDVRRLRDLPADPLPPMPDAAPP